MKHTNLSRQIHIYSLDTGCFYTQKEQHLHNCMLRYIRYRDTMKAADKEQWSEDKKAKGKRLGSHINQKIKAYKDCLTHEIKASPSITRTLPEEKLKDNRIVSAFESSLTRISGMEPDELTTDIMIVQTFFYDIIKQLLLNGYYFRNEKYVYFTSSAGQIRTKKTVFIRETLWLDIKNTLMCGLTWEDINLRGGINMNKFLSYLALSNSATERFPAFDIKKSVVVPDFETAVTCEADFINDVTYEIRRQTMDIPICHTDGCGMILPKLSRKNFMVRLPWMKGLLATFDFVKFIKMNNASPIIKDIYGKERDILKEDIQVVFTESQFKMHHYYDSWEQYQQFFLSLGCEAAVCNIEDDYFSDAAINYQMLQTLTDITAGEIDNILAPSLDTLRKISTDKKTILRIFGVTKANEDKTFLQQALEIYPELLQDDYCRARLREIKKSLVKEYRAGKLEIYGKYTFLVPDLYAFCAFLFLHIKRPDGLLGNKEVSCRLFPDNQKLDCLRSPHLYREHAIRRNCRDEDITFWFRTNAIYTSTHDAISKMLQFDVDGDRSLVVADKTFVEVAQRNMENDDVVPLYYEMKKAHPQELSAASMYEGLCAAYSGGNIGSYSNSISKIFNSVDWNNASAKKKQEALHVIKLLCMENNFCIDMAKTLYMPVRPVEIDVQMRQYINGKLPHFFRYAKDKTDAQVALRGTGFVDTLEEKITYTPIRLSAKNFGTFSYKNLMHNSRIVIDEEHVIKRYNTLNRRYHFRITPGNQDNINYLMKSIREELLTLGYNERDLCDMLVKHLYQKKTPHKELLWQCFGHIIVANLTQNIPKGSIQCNSCGHRFLPSAPNQRYCQDCSGYQPVGKKVIHCIDCRCAVEIDAKDTETCRCEKHRDEHKQKLRQEQNKRAYERRKKIQQSTILIS